ncbi:hypothetical protein FS837_011865 [Tulasnella sp. UAMH 9824]|nr:hypothetical protein FS837_011865 [Tulasnella sp. UAMH 9824]
MYDDSYDNDGTDFWKGYDSSAAASPVLGSKATFTHIEYSPSSSYSFKAAEPPSEPDVVHSSTVPELVFTQHHTASSASDTPESHPQPLSAVEHSEGEDDSSYWSQYSKVQGSGDSTVPSPRLPNGKKPELDEYGRPLFEVGADEHASSAAVEVMEYQPTASLRGDLYLHGAVGVEDEFAEEPFGRGFDDAFAAKKEDEAPAMVGGLGLNTHATAEQPEEAPLASEASDSGASSESAGSSALTSEAGLEEAMRGIYWLWKGQNADRTVEQFLSLVKRAVEP